MAARREQGQKPARQRRAFVRLGYILGLDADRSQSIRHACQSRKERARCLAIRGLVRLSIEQPLALGAHEQGGFPFSIGHIARVGAKIELGEVARQVRLADVVERAEDAALQQREMAFDRVCMSETASVNVLLGAVVDGRMTSELLADPWVDAAVIGHPSATYDRRA